MFDREEIQALVLGARIVRQFGDPALARASESILNKVAAVLPKELEPLLTDTPLFVPTTIGGSRSADGLAIAREALVAHRRIKMHYDNGRGETTDRIVRPLGVFFWGRTWTLAAWCELRVGFRNFRLDRVKTATILDAFEDQPGQTLRDLLTPVPDRGGQVAGSQRCDATETAAAESVSSSPARTNTRARSASARCTPSR